jgi:hypothetical protein
VNTERAFQRSAIEFASSQFSGASTDPRRSADREHLFVKLNVYVFGGHSGKITQKHAFSIRFLAIEQRNLRVVFAGKRIIGFGLLFV